MAAKVTALAEGGVVAARVQDVAIKAPNFQIAAIDIVGTSPYVMNRFAGREAMVSKQREGQPARNRKTRGPKDFDRLYQGAFHRFAEGDAPGLPALAFRSAMVEAARLTGITMTMAKLAIIRIVPDGLDRDKQGLVRIVGAFAPFDWPARNTSGGIDIRRRPMWDLGWTATVRVEYDADQLSAADVVNLLERAGRQVGIGDGRNMSKKSSGQMWGSFTVKREVAP